MTDQILIGTRKGFFTIVRNGSDWSVDKAELLGDRVTVLVEDRAGAIHAAQDMGHFGVKIKRSRDGGATWEERAIPQYPPMPDGYEEIDPIRQTPFKWALRTIWSLENGHADRPDELWCGTIPGGLFRSGDGGESWQIVEGLWYHPDRRNWTGGGADFPGIHSILVEPRDPDTIRIGVSCAGIWVSEDGGAQWDVRGVGQRAEFMPPEQAYEPRVQDPHCVVQCAADPNRIWIQHHNGIFRSDDAGDTCTEIVCENPSSFGFATVVDPDNLDTAWFIPGVKDQLRYPRDGRLVVTRTRDAGESFDVLSDGLPQEHAYDLIYRHAFDIDGNGERLAFGSTTGNFWISEDRGESWNLVSTTLPPVYCVKFSAS
jgi:photosystem II stability/assembly factor-like uncharacterized protein